MIPLGCKLLLSLLLLKMRCRIEKFVFVESGIKEFVMQSMGVVENDDSFG